LEDEIAELERRAIPLDESVRELRDQLLAAEKSIASATAVLRGSANRRKAEAVSRVIARIECSYTYTTAGQQDRSTLAHVRIVPVVGEPWESPHPFLSSNQPGPG
jgi:hypothetical protein